MLDFTDLFVQSKGEPIEYNGKTLHLSDKFPVKNGDILAVHIENTNSKHRQGLSIDITGHCEYEGEIFKQGKGVNMIFWEDTHSNEIKLTIFTKKDFVWVENIWEQTNYYLVSDESGKQIEQSSKSVESRYNGAAMIVEEIENGRRYRCNDGEPDDDFDDIIFTIKKVGNMKE